MDIQPSFHILIATGGRSSLERMLNSLKNELNECDAITIVFDGDTALGKSEYSKSWLQGHKSKINIIEQTPNLGYWGHGIRNKYQGILNPQTTFVLNADDDDIYLPGSFATLRRECKDPDVLYIAKIGFDYKDSYIPSQTLKITEKDIGTPCGIIPSGIADKAIWQHRYGGDFDYYNVLQGLAKNVIYIELLLYKVVSSPYSIRLHIPGVPYTITRDEYSHDAFTNKVKLFSPMMRSVGFEVYHYGIEGSKSGATKHIDLMTKDEWTELRIKSWQFVDKTLTYDQAKEKNEDPTQVISQLSNWSSPLTKEFNMRFRKHLIENYRSNTTDIVCIPLARTYQDALDKLNYVTAEVGIGYSGSYLNYRIFESYSWMSNALGREDKQPNNYWFVIPHAFDTNEFKLSLKPEPKKVGFLGRITNLKGCGIIKEIAIRFPDVQFVLCGQGDYKPYIDVPNVVYKPPIHGSERSEYLGSCVAFLHLAKYLEPFGCGPVEAQLCGTPVICSDWGGMVETVEQGTTGLRGHTIADYCYGVQMALDNKFDRQYIRDRAVRLYDMYTLAHKYEYVFRTMLEVHTPGKHGWYSRDTYIKSLLDSRPVNSYKAQNSLNLDMVYYINLDKRKDRNEHVINQLKKSNVPENKITRYTAIDGDTHVFSQQELDLFKNAFFLNTPSVKKLMGNQLSHFYIFKDMVEKGYSKILILQDDVVFREGFVDHLNKVSNSLPSDCEILNIGIHEYCYYNEFKAYDLTVKDDFLRVEKEKVNDSISIWKNTIQPCTLSYILTLAGAKNMISHFEKTGFVRETDMGFNSYLQKKNIFYGSRTILCTGDPSFGTDIFNTEAWWKKGYVKNKIYTYWTGTNEMSQNRKKCLENLKLMTGCDIELVTHITINNYILKDHPLHPAYQYLSETHKADYLRTYFMHFYGEGYSDIKQTSGSWVEAFNNIKNSDKWIIGYQEKSPYWIGYKPAAHAYKELIGNGAYICKPNTPLTLEWYTKMYRLLDDKIEKLKEFPSTHPEDCSEKSNGKYPIGWTEMLGNIFHEVCYKYKDKLMTGLPDLIVVPSTYK